MPVFRSRQNIFLVCTHSIVGMIKVITFFFLIVGNKPVNLLGVNSIPTHMRYAHCRIGIKNESFKSCCYQPKSGYLALLATQAQ